MEQLHLFQTGPFVIQSMTLRLGEVALIDTSLSFVVSDMLNPLQQSTLNGALTQVGFIQRERKGVFINSAATSPDQL